MPKGKAAPRATRAQAEALLLAGNRPAAVARKLALEPRTVQRWAVALGGKLSQVVAQKTDDDAALILGYLRAALRTMTEQLEVMGDAEWCRAQNARDLAILHGVLGDKVAGISMTAQALGLLGAPR